MKQFLKTENIHDGLTRGLVIDRGEAKIRWNLRCGDLQVGYYDLDITFHDVKITDFFISHLCNVVNLPGTELVYDEIDLIGAGILRYGLLIFCSKGVYEEVEFEFSDLDFVHTNCVGRDYEYFKHLPDRVQII